MRGSFAAGRARVRAWPGYRVPRPGLRAIVRLVLLFASSSSAVMASAPSGPDQQSTQVEEAGGWRLEVLADGLVHPWSIAWLPDGRALITERAGRLRLYADGRLLPEPVQGLPQVAALGQGGLLDVAPHPDFDQNAWVYFSYSSGSEERNRTQVGRGRLRGGRIEDFQVLYRNPDAKSGGQHFGSRLLWLPDGSLLVSIGDGGNPPISFDGAPIRNQAQNLATAFGKVLRLDADGRAHAGNPFAERPGARAEVFSFGHRNIQGLALNPQDNRVWASEHGARGGDELNQLRRGGNYGWPEVTYSREYWGPRISDTERRGDVIDPMIVWTPSIAPSGLAFYTGTEFPQWRGDLFAGALKFREVRRIDLEDGRPVGEEKLSIGQRVRDLRQGPGGGLYLLTDEDPGQLLRIRPIAEPPTPP